MIEVSIKLQYLTPALGNDRSDDVDRMLRNTSGQVIFLQSWYQAGLNYAAKALAKNQKDVAKIQFDPVVDGHVTEFRRYYSADKYKIHEAFAAGSVVGINAMLPREISIDDFEELMKIVGKYCGLSPYGWKKDYGRFEVISVERRRRARSTSKKS